MYIHCCTYNAHAYKGIYIIFKSIASIAEGNGAWIPKISISVYLYNYSDDTQN